MNKKMLIDAIATKLDITKKAAGEYVDGIFEVIANSLAEGTPVNISGFGKFDITERGERNGINPSTGKAIVIKASKSPKFKASKALKDAVNK